MRVLFYYHFLGLGGVEASILSRIHALRKIGIQAHYWFSEYYGEGARYVAEKDYVLKVDIHNERFTDRLSSFDVVVIIDFPELVKRLESVDFGKPVIYESHASYPPALQRYYSVLCSPVIQGLVVPSEYNRQLMLDSGYQDLSPKVISNCVDIDKRQQPFQFAKSGRLATQVLWVGRMEDEKNPIEAIRIAKIVESKLSGIEFLMLGDTPNYNEYVSELRANMGGQFPKSVRFERSKPFEEMKNLYEKVAQDGGVLLSTSKFESSPMIFLEAMSCRCPIVSSDVGGVSILLNQGRFGELYRSGDVQEAAAKIIALADTNAIGKRKRMVEGAFSYVLAEHAPDKVAAEFATFLDYCSRAG